VPRGWSGTRADKRSPKISGQSVRFCPGVYLSPRAGRPVPIESTAGSFGPSARKLDHLGHELAKAKSENFSDLNIPISVLYLLTRKSTSDEARDLVIKAARRGQQLSLARAQKIVADVDAEQHRLAEARAQPRQIHYVGKDTTGPIVQVEVHGRDTTAPPVAVPYYTREPASPPVTNEPAPTDAKILPLVSHELTKVITAHDVITSGKLHSSALRSAVRDLDFFISRHRTTMPEAIGLIEKAREMFADELATMEVKDFAG
jgi:hypothetical protein